jgi:hypothetical protein
MAGSTYRDDLDGQPRETKKELLAKGYQPSLDTPVATTAIINFTIMAHRPATSNSLSGTPDQVYAC